MHNWTIEHNVVTFSKLFQSSTISNKANLPVNSRELSCGKKLSVGYIVVIKYCLHTSAKKWYVVVSAFRGCLSVEVSGRTAGM